MFGTSTCNWYCTIFYTLQFLRKEIPLHVHQDAVHHAYIQAEYLSKLKQEFEKTSQNQSERIDSIEQRLTQAERQLHSYEQQVQGETRDRNPDQCSTKTSHLEQQAARSNAQLSQIQKRSSKAGSGYGTGVHNGQYSASTPKVNP